jgi:hypothetical protein
VLLAVLLQAFFAARAPSAGIHETADPGEIAGFEALCLGSDARHASDDFVSGDHGKNRTAPLVPCLMDVGVADAAVEDFDEHIMRTRFAPLEGEWFELRGRTCGGVSAYRWHGVISS